jgi:hypothetical protein
MSTRTAVLLALTLIATVSVRSGAQAPQSGPCSYETCAVRHTIGFFGERLVRGASSEEVVKINFSGSNAADYLSRVESAAGPARDFRTRRTRATVLGIISGLAAGYFAATVVVRGANAEDPSSAEYAALWGAVGVGIFSGLEASRSRNSLSRAIWEFNRAPVP